MKVTQDVTKQKECTAEVMAWLHHVWEMQGRGEVVQPDPFYERSALLTEDVVRGVLTSITNLMLDEFKKFPGYHYPAQNVKQGEVMLVPPPYLTMPYAVQFAIVQGIDRIMQPYRVEDVVTPPNLEGPPYIEGAPSSDYY
jgi:hypothetical protein